MPRLSKIPSCAGLLTRLAFAQAHIAGVDVPPLLRRARLSARDIKNEKAVLPVASQVRFLDLMADEMSDKLMGFHLMESVDLRYLGFFHYLIASSDNLGSALENMARYSAIANEGIRLHVELGKTFRIAIDYAGVSRLSDRHQIEGWITGVIRSVRQCAGRDLKPVRLRLMHQRIAESTQFDNFVGCHVQFGSSEDEIVFPGEAASLRLLGADDYLNRLLIAEFDKALARHRKPPGELRTDVENAIAPLLPNAQAQIDRVAEKLGMSPRTLRRRLTAEGVTFARILEELRLALAKHYLAEDGLSISRIAWLLGYTEVSAFSHAFRRWTGRSPRTGRQQR
jgi:AraC-like DNA-binding protein